MANPTQELISDALDAWRKSDSGLALHEWFGWTEAEGRLFLVTGEVPDRELDVNAALQRSPTRLTQYAIYDHPRDYPEHFVVRPWDIAPGKLTPRAVCGKFEKLEAARAWCAQWGLYCLGTMQGDDPKLVEVWT